MVRLIFVPQSLKDFNGLLLGGLADLDGLKTPFKRAVLFNIFAVFFKRCCADNLKLAPCKRRLEDICGVNRALGGACAYKIMNLINKEDNVLCLGYLVDTAFYSFFKISSVFCSGNHSGKVKRHNALILEQLGNLALCNPQRQTFRNRGFAYARLAYKAGIVLGAP